MTITEMHECEYHLAEVFAKAWDEAYQLVLKDETGELTPEFFEEAYKNCNKVCSSFDNFDVQFDTIDTCLKHMPKSSPLAGIAFCVVVAYQVEEQTFGFSIYFGEARSEDYLKADALYKGKYCDVSCLMSASEDIKETHMLEHFHQLKG